MQPPPSEPPADACVRLAELAAARDAAIARKTAFANRLWTTELAFLRRELAAQLRSLERHIARIDKAVDTHIVQPPRHIHGGPAALRKTLYMAVLVASRRNPDLSRFHQNLTNKGKPPKLPLIAVAPKNSSFSPTPSSLKTGHGKRQ